MIPAQAQRAARGDPAAQRAAGERIRLLVVADPALAVAEAGKALRTAKREKHLANTHRRRARSAMFAFVEFKRNLEARGIAVVFEGDASQSATNAPGGTSERDEREQEQEGAA